MSSCNRNEQAVILAFLSSLFFFSFICIKILLYEDLIVFKNSWKGSDQLIIP